MTKSKFQKRSLFMLAYIVFALLPIYWMVNMSFKTNEEILSTFSLWPQHFTTDHYRTIFTDVSWYSGYINSMIYVAINTVISLLVALPAAYAFSRYSFLGDKHVFFWLLTNRMTPPAVFLLPFFQLYTTLGLMDTHIAVALAHLLFNVPLAVWILEGFMSGVPREIDETAYLDGYTFPRFFFKIFLPLATYGPSLALIQGLTPDSMRSGKPSACAIGTIAGEVRRVRGGPSNVMRKPKPTVTALVPSGSMRPVSSRALPRRV